MRNWEGLGKTDAKLPVSKNQNWTGLTLCRPASGCAFGVGISHASVCRRHLAEATSTPRSLLKCILFVCQFWAPCVNTLFAMTKLNQNSSKNCNHNSDKTQPVLPQFSLSFAPVFSTMKTPIVCVWNLLTPQFQHSRNTQIKLVWSAGSVGDSHCCGQVQPPIFGSLRVFGFMTKPFLTYVRVERGNTWKLKRIKKVNVHRSEMLTGPWGCSQSQAWTKSLSGTVNKTHLNICRKCTVILSTHSAIVHLTDASELKLSRLNSVVNLTCCNVARSHNWYA